MPERDTTFVENGVLTVVQIEEPSRDRTYVDENGNLIVVSAGEEEPE